MSDLPLTHRIHPASFGRPPHPALFLLHGLGSDELDLLSLAPQLDPRVFAVSLRAPSEYQWGGHMWFDLEREGWSLGSAGIEHSLGLLRDFVGLAMERYPLDPHRLYAGGFSMGAAMAAALALLEPGTIAGALVISGWLPPDPNGQYRAPEAAGHPIFQAHGTRDQLIPVTAARQTRDVLSHMPVDLTYREYPIGHEVSQAEIHDMAAWLKGVLDAPRPTV